MKILVIGRQGQVARALVRRAERAGVVIEALGRPEFDLERPNDDLIISKRPGVVINAAAYTAVDKAESEPDRAFQVNAAGAQVVSRAAAQAGAPVIHISTDYVFSGDKLKPYLESDAVGPTGVYGASKLEGEALSFAANSRAMVVRTAWVFDAQGANFVRTILRLAKSRPQIDVVDDQRGCPTYADDLADALLNMAHRLVAGQGKTGVYHCAGAGEATWAQAAREVFTLARLRGGPAAEVTPIRTADYPTLAKRPANSRLDCTKLADDYGVRMRPWQEALAACVDEIAAGGWRVE